MNVYWEWHDRLSVLASEVDAIAERIGEQTLMEVQLRMAVVGCLMGQVHQEIIQHLTEVTSRN